MQEKIPLGYNFLKCSIACKIRAHARILVNTTKTKSDLEKSRAPAQIPNTFSGHRCAKKAADAHKHMHCSSKNHFKTQTAHGTKNRFFYFTSHSSSKKVRMQC